MNRLHKAVEKSQTPHQELDATNSGGNNKQRITPGTTGAVPYQNLRFGTGQKEFLDLYDQHANSIYRFILFKVSNADMAWDLAQDCFMKVWEYWSRKPGEIANPKAFLFTVARNLVIDFWRARARTQTVELDTETMDVAIDVGNSAHDRLVLRDEIQEVMQLLDRLPPDDREVLTLRFTEELSFREIAHITGKGEIAVRVQAHRAIKKLKLMLKP